jgi:adenylate cyclase
MVVAFTNFTRYTAQADRLEDLVVARVMDRYYALAGSRIAAGGGRVVKFIGDGMLAVFPPKRAERGVLALVDLKDAADRFMEEQGWECRLLVKIHFGTVAAGRFGAGTARRYDVLGKTVNFAARLQGSGVTLSEEAYRLLGPEVRRRFKKHTPPVTYVRRLDVELPRWAGGG